MKTYNSIINVLLIININKAFFESSLWQDIYCSIGLEGLKEELLEFLSDFKINKIAISFVGDRMVLTTSIPVDGF